MAAANSLGAKAMGKAVLFAIAVFSCASVHGQDASPGTFVTGNDLFGQLKERDVVMNAYGYGFVLGAHDSMNGIKSTSTGYCFHTPKQITRQQTADIVLKWLEENPQHRHFTAGSLVAAALSKAFPCR